MSHLFQRPMCDLGAAYDFAYRPVLGAPDVDAAGGCDDRPAKVALYAATADPFDRQPVWSTFGVCAGHVGELRRYDAEFVKRGRGSRFRTDGGKS
jgi:hypothetical protein